EYEPGTGRVTRVGRLPVAITHAAAATLAGIVYVIGGRGTLVGTPTARNVSIDTASRQIRPAGRLVAARSDLAAVTLGGGILVVGGRGRQGSESRIGELLPQAEPLAAARSEERRVVKECGARWAAGQAEAQARREA